VYLPAAGAGIKQACSIRTGVLLPGHGMRLARRPGRRTAVSDYYLAPSWTAATSLLGALVIILGIILLIIGFVAKIAIIWTIGIIVVVIGVILAILGMVGHAVGGRKHYF
jgi:fatty acid desaturase